jgi:hypothetical protein
VRSGVYETDVRRNELMGRWVGRIATHASLWITLGRDTAGIRDTRVPVDKLKNLMANQFFTCRVAASFNED